MVWDQLSINKPHLVYIILGGFTSIFMLVSLFIKEKLYIGEATVATLCGLIFGPHSANLINPLSWGNTDQITLEFSRIVLVVQCFAVGVELPKNYMERHWLSVVLLLVPVMTFGWLITSLFIWWMIEPLTWLESLCAAACVTATDPVLASSVVGKGKFAKRVPKHIRDLLSAESGCNDGMAFPFIYLALYLIHYHLDAKHVVQHWICNTILYECVWGAVYGVLVGYIARQAIKLAERKGIIDRESFLVFYFVLALFCAGSGSMLGMDDLLIGFAAGVGFSNDGWFTEKTEESHVSNVIDLLLNLTYFVYLGTIIPWDQYNSGLHGLEAWRLVVIALMVIFFRRIPIMLMLKPIIPDIKTWREALFCGHFGPIGVGAIFVAILARAELETGGTTPLAVLPDPSDAEYVLIYTIWPITTFLVITSIVVHGSSIAVFTLGKRINTLTLTLSYTTGNSESANWMERLPRIASRSRSQGKSFTSDISDMSDVEKSGLPPMGGVQPLVLRRQKDEEYEREKPIGRPNIKDRAKRKKKKKDEENYGGPISQSAIAPQRNSEPNLALRESGSEVLDEKTEGYFVPRPSADRPVGHRSAGSDGDIVRVRRDTLKHGSKKEGSSESDSEEDVDIEVFEEREHMIIEDAEGNVIDTVDIRGKTEEEKAAIVAQAKTRVRKDSSGKYAKHENEPHKKDEGQEIKESIADAAEHPEKHFRDHFKNWKGFGKTSASEQGGSQKPERKRGPAHAYQFGNTIIVEDEDGEVIHKYDIPRGENDPGYNEYMRERMHRMGTWIGLGRRSSQMPPKPSASTETAAKPDDVEDTSSGSPDKEKQDPASNTLSPNDAKRDRPSQQRQQSGFQDDGLRMVISNAEQYGLTGLRKSRQGDRPGMEMGGGRRMSAVDFIKQMQQLDKQNRQEAMDAAGMSQDIKDSINRSVGSRSAEKMDESRPRPQRAGTTPLQKYKSPIQEEEEEDDTRRSSGRRRSQSDAMSPKRPQDPQRSHTNESLVSREEESDEEEIPTHNVRSTIARYGQGGRSAADARRERYNSSVQSPIHEDDEEEDPEGETAAEKRRRLAALGIGRADSDSSSEEEGDSPRVKRTAVQEPGQSFGDVSSPPPRTREQMAEAPRMRVQWGGETRGVVRGKGGDDEEAQRGSGSGSQRDSTGSAGARIRGLFRKS